MYCYYAILRRTDYQTEEFMNIGLLVYFPFQEKSDVAHIEFVFPDNFARVKASFPSVDADRILKYCNAFKDIARGYYDTQMVIDKAHRTIKSIKGFEEFVNSNFLPTGYGGNNISFCKVGKKSKYFGNIKEMKEEIFKKYFSNYTTQN